MRNKPLTQEYYDTQKRLCEGCKYNCKTIDDLYNIKKYGMKKRSFTGGI